MSRSDSSIVRNELYDVLEKLRLVLEQPLKQKQTKKLQSAYNKVNAVRYEFLEDSS